MDIEEGGDSVTDGTCLTHRVLAELMNKAEDFGDAGDGDAHQFLRDLVAAEQRKLAAADNFPVAGCSACVDTGMMATWEDPSEPEQSHFNSLLEEYSDLHGYGHKEPEELIEECSLEPDALFMLVEKNVRGGYWLKTGDDWQHLLREHYDQEYAGDWEEEGLFDLVTGERIEVEMQFTIVRRVAAAC